MPPSTLPLLPLATNTLAGEKRVRGHPELDFEAALVDYHTISSSLDVSQRPRFWLNVVDFLIDQANVSVMWFDCETSEAIASGTPIERMRATITCVTLIERQNLHRADALATALRFDVWPESTGRGVPYSVLLAVIERATETTLCGYNAHAFDLRLLARGNNVLLADWRSRLEDPFRQLRQHTEERELKLDNLLRINGLATKLGDGLLAVRLWKAGKLDELTEYCRQDTDSLARLTLLPQIVLPSGVVTRLISLLPMADTRQLVQGTLAWKRARKGLLTASVVPNLLGLGYGADEAFERLLGLAPPVEDNEHLQRGRRLEPKAAALFARRTGFSLEETGLWSREVSGLPLAASPDRMLVDQNAILEIKCPAKLAAVRDSTIVQATLQLLVTQRDVCYIATSVPPALEIQQLFYDSDLAELILLALEPIHAELMRAVPVSEKSLPFMTPIVRRDLKTALKQTRDGYLRQWG